MNRPIKFRGRDSFTNEFHYGFYFADEDGVQVFENRHSYLVEPESVAQLVGFDADDREVYEGDTVCDKHGIHYFVRLIPQVPVANMTVKEELK